MPLAEQHRTHAHNLIKFDLFVGVRRSAFLPRQESERVIKGKIRKVRK